MKQILLKEQRIALEAYREHCQRLRLPMSPEGFIQLHFPCFLNWSQDYCNVVDMLRQDRGREATEAIIRMASIKVF